MPCGRGEGSADFPAASDCRACCKYSLDSFPAGVIMQFSIRICIYLSGL